MIMLITFEDIRKIWSEHLWPERKSPIETHSAMMLDGSINMANFSQPAFYYGVEHDKKLIAVNSAHRCADNSLRLRGLWVAPSYRRLGLATDLIRKACADWRECDFAWSFPRTDAAVFIYQQLGFHVVSTPQPSETSPSNVYVKKQL